MDPRSTENICRICLHVQDTLFSLYRKSLGTSPYEKLISKTKLHIQLNDSGPASICSQCLIDLDTTISFLDKCERSNRILAARFVRGFHEECLDFKSANGTPVFPEKVAVKAVFHEASSAPSVEQKSEDEELVKEMSLSMVCDDKCGECGSKRRCRHWAPPTLFTCQHCRKTFNKKYNYQLHVKRHLGQAEWRCGVCDAGAASRWAAERHCRARARLPCPAPACASSFTTTTNLQTHLRKHTGEKPFGCDHCGKSFISKNILKNHIRIHTGVKPYMCQICGKQFATNKLSRHMWSHGVGVGVGGGGMHACPCAGCSRAFRSARALRSHARSHAARRDFACALCDAAYKYKQSLNYHVKHAHGVRAERKVVPGSI